MNIFSTEHPLVAQPSLLDVKEFPVAAYARRILLATLVLWPVFMAMAGLEMLSAGSPDVPDPSWADPIWDVIGFAMNFPFFFLLRFDPPSHRFIFTGTFIDALFWACVGVFLYALVRQAGIRFKRSR